MSRSRRFAFTFVLVALVACSSKRNDDAQQAFERVRPQLTQTVERLQGVLKEAAAVREFAPLSRAPIKLAFGAQRNAAIVDVRQADPAWDIGVGTSARYPFLDVSLDAAQSMLKTGVPAAMPADQVTAFVRDAESITAKLASLRYLVVVREQSFESPTLAGSSFTPGKYVITALLYDLEGPKLLGGHTSTSLISAPKLSAEGTDRDNAKMLEEVLYRQGKADLLAALRQIFEVTD